MRARPQRRSVEEAHEAGEPRASRPAPGRELSPQALLALQRAGAGNHALARAILARNGGGDGDGQQVVIEDAEDDAPALPPIPAPFPPLIQVQLPIVIPAANIPPGYRWMFGLPEPVWTPPTMPLMIEWKPQEAEQEPKEPEAEAATDSEPETTEAPTAKKKKKKKKKKKPPAEASAQSAPKAPAEPVKAEPTPPPEPEKEKSVDEIMAEMGLSDGPGPRGRPERRAKPKSEAQKQHERREAEKRKAKEEAADKSRKQQEEREKAELLKETQLRTSQLETLDKLRTLLVAARDGLPGGGDYAAIRQEASTGVTDLGKYLKGAGTKADSTELAAKIVEINKLIVKVKDFRPPETPEQRLARLWESMKTNVGLAIGRESWNGPMGGQTDFTVDKYDAEMWDKIRVHYGRDTVEVPGHAAKSYTGKTSTSKVYYYVTGSSHTPGIAYDISLHAWDGDRRIGTVLVLHIPHKAE